VKIAQLLQSQAEEAGIQVTLDQVEQTEIINTAAAKSFEAVLWRNHPGGDPDTQKVWWYSQTETGADNFINFSGINNPEINRIFDEGRSETDPAARAEIYKELPKVFAEEGYNIWGWYTLWSFAAADNVRGLFPPQLPDGQEPVVIASVQPVVGIWFD
jgi:peptide/nickel transport system substrate-binding protein